jgi:RNA polymerase sigma factor (sigma-70 family)
MASEHPARHRDIHPRVRRTGHSMGTLQDLGASFLSCLGRRAGMHSAHRHTGSPRTASLRTVVITDSSVAQAGAEEHQPDASSPAGPEQFFREHYRDLIKITMYAGANQEQAMEAASAAVEEMLRPDRNSPGHRTWDRLQDPLKWGFRAAINHYLKEKTRGLDTRRLRLAEVGAGTAEGSDDAQLTVWEDVQWVEQMLASLPPKQAEAMRLVTKGFTPNEIAELLGRTPEAVRQNLVEARRRLKKEILQSAPSHNAQSRLRSRLRH